MLRQLKISVFGLMALTGAMSPNLLWAQLRQHVIWPIGPNGYVMDFKKYPPSFYKPSAYNYTEQFMSFLADSTGNFYLGMRLNNRPCGERLVNRYLDTGIIFPIYEPCHRWKTFMLQMPNYRRSSIVRYYNHYFYTKRYPDGYDYLLNLGEDSSRFVDTTAFDFGFKNSSGIHRVIYSPDCQAVYLYHIGLNGSPAKGPWYPELLKVINGKCVRRVAQPLPNIVQDGNPAGPIYTSLLNFSPDLSHCILTEGMGVLGIHRFDRENMRIQPEPLMTFRNVVSYTFSYSLNGRKLYYIQGDTLYQTDVTVLHKDTIRKRTRAIVGYPFKVQGLQMMHLLPSGQLMVSFEAKKYPDLIHYPDLEGTACGYKFDDLYIPWDTIGYLNNDIPIDSLFKDGGVDVLFPYEWFIPQGAYYNPGVQVVQGRTACAGVPHAVKADYYRDFIRMEWKVSDPSGKVIYVSNADSFRFTPADTGTYRTTLYYRWSCNLLDSAHSNFRVQAIRIPPPLPDTVLCYGLQFLLRSDSSYGQRSTSWFQNNRYLGTGDTIRVGEAGIYRRRLDYGCMAMEDTFEVKVIPEPSRPVDEMYVICKDRNSTFVTVNPPPATAVSWNTGARGRILEVDTPGRYWVNFRNKCYDSTWQFRVREEIPGYTLLIPDAFTPNGDALNETFQIAGLEELESYRCEIYNRWGQMVFSTTDKKQFWDGKYQGRPAPKGVYIYVIRGKSKCSITDLFKGVFHLL